MREDAQKISVESIKYVGSKDMREFTVLPYPVEDTERRVTFTKGEEKLVDVDIKAETAVYLKRDYKDQFAIFQKDYSIKRYFKKLFHKSILEYGLTKEDMQSVIDSIYEETREKMSTTERAKLAAKKRWEKK